MTLPIAHCCAMVTLTRKYIYSLYALINLELAFTDKDDITHSVTSVMWETCTNDLDVLLTCANNLRKLSMELGCLEIVPSVHIKKFIND